MVRVEKAHLMMADLVVFLVMEGVVRFLFPTPLQGTTRLLLGLAKMVTMEDRVEEGVLVVLVVEAVEWQMVDVVVVLDLVVGLVEAAVAVLLPVLLPQSAL